MKRAIILIALVVMTFFGVYYVQTSAPIMPIVGNSMEPMLKLGDLIVIGDVDPSQVKEGDVIVFNVPGLIREKYGYPAVVAHRVIKVITDSGSISFRTKGDNTGEDPFTVLSSDLRGQMVKQIPHGGYLPLFLQSKQGMYFMVIALVLLAICFYGDDIQQKWQKTRRSLLAPVFEENQKIMQRQDEAMEASAKALQQFATAMGEYAQHLASHTSAVKDMASASQEIRKAVQEQNQMFRSWQGVSEKTRKEITAESYTESQDGINLLGAAGQSAPLTVVGEAAKVEVVAQAPDGTPLVAVVRLYKVVSGQRYDFGYSETGKLSLKISPGEYVIEAYIGGEKLSEDNFTIGANEERKIELVLKTVYFEGVLVEPIYTENRQLAAARVVYTVNNLYKSVPKATAELKVSRDGALLEKVNLATLAPLDKGQLSLNNNYIPAGGWQKSTYGFKLELYMDGEVYTSSEEAKLSAVTAADMPSAPPIRLLS